MMTFNGSSYDYKKNIDLFRQKNYRLVNNMILQTLSLKKLEIDAEVNPSDINFPFVKKLESMEPYGEGNPKPVFLLRNMTIQAIKAVPKDNPKHLQITFMNGDNVFKSIFFKSIHLMEDLQQAIAVDIAFTLGFNSFHGKTEIQLMIIDIKPSSLNEFYKSAQYNAVALNT